MPILTANLPWYLSVKTGAAGNSTAQSDANLSLGKYISTTTAPTTLNALFDSVSAARNAASEVDYRCVFVRNTHATITGTGGKVWLSGADPAGGLVWTIAVDSIAASAIGASSAQAQEATTDTAPGAGVTGLSFSAPTSDAGGISFGDLAPGQCRAVWIKCAAANTAAVTETITLSVAFDTIA